MINLFDRKVTIYNDIPADKVNPRRFERFVIEKCNVQGGYVEMSDGTIQNIVNAQTVITKDVKRFKLPNEYVGIPISERDGCFTAQVDDFIVFDEVDDVVTTSREYEELQRKYSKNGMLITSVNPHIFGTDVDNVTMTNA